MKRKRFIFSMPADLHHRLKIIAAEKKTTMTIIVCNAVQKQMEASDRQAPQAR